MIALGWLISGLLITWLIWPEFIGERIADTVEAFRDRCRDHDRGDT